MKRIVICADGTWNIQDQKVPGQLTRRPTNVTKVARAVVTRIPGVGGAEAVDQVVFYHAGIGTGRGLDKVTGGAFGDGIENNIRELYRSIIYNYEAGDALYFFGFSRGAFTVRSLIGFLNAVGLVHKGDDYWVPELYECYQSGKRPGSPEWQATLTHLEHPVLPCPPIKFVGVWDTVGALGAPGLLGQLFNRKKYKYHDVSLNDHIENAYQALAIDERRRPFAPSVWERPPGWTGKLEQAWFAGVHSDVGGGQPRDGLANEALHWIVEKAEGCGLVFDSDFLAHFKPCFNGDLHDSMSPMYRVMVPITRQIGGRGQNGEAAHEAAIDRCLMTKLAYDPSNLKVFRSQNPAIQPYDTTRIARGTPC